MHRVTYEREIGKIPERLAHPQAKCGFEQGRRTRAFGYDEDAIVGTYWTSLFPAHLSDRLDVLFGRNATLAARRLDHGRFAVQMSLPLKETRTFGSRAEGPTCVS